MSKENPITRTTDRNMAIVPRVIAGLPLVGFGVMHLVNPDGFRDILIASGIPMVEVNVYAAPVAEVIGGVLLLLGLYARVGGIFGITTMLVALYTTMVLSGMIVANLPGGLMEVPQVPPLPLPVMVAAASLVVVIVGGGTWSLDLRNQSS